MTSPEPIETNAATMRMAKSLNTKRSIEKLVSKPPPTTAAAAAATRPNVPPTSRGSKFDATPIRATPTRRERDTVWERVIDRVDIETRRVPLEVRARGVATLGEETPVETDARARLGVVSVAKDVPGSTLDETRRRTCGVSSR
mmetsp:Transcript_4316/g.15980  ORF Transcript_4316/g.15980 Transcript_4316/m.15980 type:complete len:143 (-) Transcript_4316:1290-1718(-)